MDKNKYICKECKVYLMDSNRKKMECPFGHEINEDECKKQELVKKEEM